MHRRFQNATESSEGKNHDYFEDPPVAEKEGKMGQHIVCYEKNVLSQIVPGNDCIECNLKFSNVYNLKRHIGRKHPDKLPTFVSSRKLRPINCKFCNKNFTKTYLVVHQRKEHGVFANITSHNCPICRSAFEKNDMLKHLVDIHEIVLESEELNFHSFAEFLSWKVTIEKESKCRYKKVTTPKSSSKIKYTYYRCHRSGNFVSRGKGVRHLKAQGSKKINAFCPASMRVKQMKGGECVVDIQKKHVGHLDDICHLNLTLEERRNLASKIAAKLPFKAILDGVQSSVSNENVVLTRLLTRKDLHNIAASFKLSSNFMHSSNDTEGMHSSNGTDLWMIDNTLQPASNLEIGEKSEMCISTNTLHSSNLDLQKGFDARKDKLIKCFTEQVSASSTNEELIVFEKTVASLRQKLNVLPSGRTIPANKSIQPQRRLHSTKRKKNPA